MLPGMNKSYMSLIKSTNKQNVRTSFQASV